MVRRTRHPHNMVVHHVFRHNLEFGVQELRRAETNWGAILEQLVENGQDCVGRNAADEDVIVWILDAELGESEVVTSD
jgi:hypothetical protein